jgi:uncharacterized protein (TIGR04255 family)
MATRKYIPAKLKHDAIVEALLEVRFDMATVPEILFGRLADSAAWKAFEQRGMPAYDIPASLRQVTPNLRYQPVFELLNADKNRAVRIGAQVLSYHRLPPYENWMQFKPELGATIDGLFAKADGLTVRRLGLRYINALRPELHRIRSISELDLKVVVETEAVAANVNVNFTTDLSDDTQCTVRVATTEFVRGTLPKNTSVLIDVDVFTNEAFATQDADKVKQWVDFAHEREKEQFFRLLTHETIDMIEDK